MENSKGLLDESTNIVNKNKYKDMEETAAKLINARSGNEGTSNLGSGSTEREQYPVIKQADLSKLLPKFTSILSRNPDDGVQMKDLDMIQVELEKLLSTCEVRQRAFRSDTDAMDKVVEKKERRGKIRVKTVIKRRKMVTKPRMKNKNARNILRILKNKQNVPACAASAAQTEISPVPPILKHQMLDRFWASVDSYCQDISQDNLLFLDELVKECSEEVDLKVPSLGEHYTSDWSDHGMQDDQSNGCITTDNLEQEKVIASFLSAEFDKFKSGDYIKDVGGIRNGLCLEKRLRKEGILELDDITRAISRNDEIQMEIEKCQKQLQEVNEHNLKEVTKLRDAVRKDMHKQEIKVALEKVDQDILKMYQKVLEAKEKEEDFGEFEHKAYTLIKLQSYLHSKLRGINGVNE